MPPHPAFALADDLSGALEVAGEYHLSGWRSALPVGGDADPSQSPWPIDLAVVSTETRLSTPGEARRVLRDVLGRVPGGGRAVAYKKIDSTLRGPIGEELDELLTLTPGRCALVSPANPLAGRTVIDGVVHVDGVPVGETEFARAPTWPVTDSRVGTVLEAAGVPWAGLDRSTVGAGVDACLGRLAELTGAGRRAIVADALDEDDLATLARAVAGSDGRLLAVGSGGLARALARRGLLRRPCREQTSFLSGSEAMGQTQPGLGARLVVCGSGHEASLAQLEMLRRREGVGVTEMFPSGDVADDLAGALERSRREVGERLREKGGASLVGGSGASRVVGELGSRAVGDWLEALLGALAGEASIGAVIATGGETARRACAALGVEWLGLIERIEPGLVASVDAPGGRFWLTKPGGFGQADTMCRAWRWLERSPWPGADAPPVEER